MHEDPLEFSSLYCAISFNSHITFQVEEKKQAAADVLFQYSNFVMACIGNQVRPCDLRLHLMKVRCINEFFCCISVTWEQSHEYNV